MAGNPSGTLRIEGNTIIYESPPNSWRIELIDLLAFGEYTTPDGPYLDDYWLVFLYSAGVYQAPFYAAGRTEFLELLGSKLGSSFQFQLAGSTDYASNVLWPRLIAGQRFFDFDEVAPSSFNKRIMQMFVGKTYTVQMSKQILALLPTRPDDLASVSLDNNTGTADEG